MHTAHCARNITLCRVCKEPIPKNQFETHAKKCVAKVEKPKPLPLPLETNDYYTKQKEVQDRKNAQRREEYLQRHEKFIDKGFTLKETVSKGENKNGIASSVVENGVKPKPKQSSLIPCKYCELELPKLDLIEHENYCGARTDKCPECGELVMFKYKQLHEDSNHGFLKLNDGEIIFQLILF